MIKAFTAVANSIRTAVGGLLQVVGPTAGTTRTMTVPDANFAAARTDAGQSFAGNQTLANGNLIIGASSKGIDFSANANAAGMTGELLTWYEEGTFTPTDTSGAGLTFANAEGRYTRIGRMVFASFSVTYPTTADSSNASISLPFLAKSMARNSYPGAVAYTDYGTAFSGFVFQSNCLMYLFGGSIMLNNTVSGQNIRMTVIYEAA